MRKLWSESAPPPPPPASDPPRDLRLMPATTGCFFFDLAPKSESESAERARDDWNVAGALVAFVREGRRSGCIPRSKDRAYTHVANCWPDCWTPSRHSTFSPCSCSAWLCAPQTRRHRRRRPLPRHRLGRRQRPSTLPFRRRWRASRRHMASPTRTSRRVRRPARGWNPSARARSLSGCTRTLPVPRLSLSLRLRPYSSGSISACRAGSAALPLPLPLPLPLL